MFIRKIDGIIFVTIDSTPFTSFTFKLNNLDDFDKLVYRDSKLLKELRTNFWWNNDIKNHLGDILEDYYKENNL